MVFFKKGDIINNIDKIMLEIWNFHQRLLYLISVILFSVIGNFRLIVKNKRKEIQSSQSNKARNKNCMILTC